MARRGKWPGTWAAICDRCGFRFPSSDLRKEWDNLMVCGSCWEPRHPQDFIRGVPDNPAPPWTRPEPITGDILIIVCDLISSQGRADWGTADCAKADYIVTIMQCLLHPSALANAAQADCAIADVRI